MANKKITKRDYFAILRESYPATAENYDEVIAFIDHELELLAKKNSAERKPTAAQKENEGIKAIILAALTTTPTSISDLQKKDAALAEISNQKISALLRQLIIDNKVVRTEDKKKALFALIG